MSIGIDQSEIEKQESSNESSAQSSQLETPKSPEASAQPDRATPQEVADNEVYTEANAFRTAAYEVLEKEIDNPDKEDEPISDDEILQRFIAIDVEFIDRMTRPLLERGNKSGENQVDQSENQELLFDNVVATLKESDIEIPKPIQEARSRVVEEVMVALNIQDIFLENGILSQNGKQALAGLVEKAGVTLSDEMTREQVQALIEQQVPYQLVIASCSANEVHKREALQQFLAQNNLKDTQQASETEEAGSDNAVPNEIKQQFASEDKAKVRKAWLAAKHYVAQNAEATNVGEFMKLFMGLDTVQGGGFGRVKENEEALLSGQQVGKKDIIEATEKGDAARLQSLLVHMLSELSTSVVSSLVSVDLSQLTQMDKTEFIQLAEEKNLFLIVEKLLSHNEETQKKAFKGLKKWLTTESAVESTKKQAWKENLEIEGWTQTAHEQLLEYFSML